MPRHVAPYGSWKSPISADLIASIKRLGVLQPISVRYVETEDIYQIISGERRFQASKARSIGRTSDP